MGRYEKYQRGLRADVWSRAQQVLRQIRDAEARQLRFADVYDEARRYMRSRCK